MLSNELLLNITLPVHNEERVLTRNTCVLLEFLCEHFSLEQFLVIIADNASLDETNAIGQSLVKAHKEVRYLRLPEPGKGGAIRAAWQSFPAQVNCFMDIDLATDLAALPELVNRVRSGAEVVYGSRTHRQSVVRRSFTRAIFGAGYRTALRLATGISDDVACGFKAISRRLVQEILPQVIDNGFAFDRELVVLATSLGYRVEAIPVTWVEVRDPARKSQVPLIRTAARDLHHLWRLHCRLRRLRT